MKQNLLALSLACLFGLTACEQGQPVPPQTIPASATSETASAASSTTSTQLTEIEQLVNDLTKQTIQQKLATGELKKEDLNEEALKELYLATKTVVEAMNRNVQKNDTGMMDMLRTLNQAQQSQPKTVSGAEVDVYDSEESKQLGALIKQKVPNTVVNKINKIFDTNLFTVYLNNVDNPVYTNKNADFYILRQMNGLSDVLKANGEPTQLNNEKGQLLAFSVEKGQIYRQIMSNINTQYAPKWVFGKGEKKVYIFSDPDCPFCKSLDMAFHQHLKPEDNVTIYYIMNPLLSLHPEALDKASKILCDANPDTAWKNWMLDRKLPDKKMSEAQTKTCDQRVVNQMAYSTILGFNSTPSIVNEYGSVWADGVPQVMDRAFIEQILNKKPANVVSQVGKF